MPERLQKYLARCGVGSRRRCEELIEQGRVTIDGEVVREMGTRVNPETQTVCYNGKPVTPEALVYYVLNKPPGYVCTSYDPQGRPRAIDLLPDSIGRVYTVGRLDSDSEGLIIITNDGSFAHQLSHPRYEVLKTYELSLQSPLFDDQLKEWRTGIEHDGDILKVISIKHISSGKAGCLYRVVLGEGKNRHIRRMAERTDIKVLRLKRLAIGSLSLGTLKRGASRILTAKEVRRLVAAESVE